MTQFEGNDFPKLEALVPEYGELLRPKVHPLEKALPAQKRYNNLVSRWKQYKQEGRKQDAVLACSEATVVSLKKKVELDPEHKNVRGLYVSFFKAMSEIPDQDSENPNQYFSLSELGSIKEHSKNAIKKPRLYG